MSLTRRFFSILITTCNSAELYGGSKVTAYQSETYNNNNNCLFLSIVAIKQLVPKEG